MPFSDLDTWLRARAAADQFSGVVLVHRGPEEVFSGAYGWASRRWPIPVTLDMRFDTASITKLFTSVTALQLVDGGRLSLDASLTGLVDLAGTTISDAVTIRHLLLHTSGIADDADEEDNEDYEALWVDKPCYAVTETRHFLPQFVHKPPRFAPGEGCRYCNVGYILVGLAIEAVTGLSYRDQVRRAVFAPAGMSASDFYDRREAVTGVAEGWDPVTEDGRITGWRQNIFSYPPIGSPDGGAHVTAYDLVRFMQAVRAGELLSPELTAQFLAPQVLHHKEDDGLERWHSFGLEFVRYPDGTVRNSFKEGAIAGVSGLLSHYPAAGLDAAVLSNSANGAWEPAAEIRRRVLGG